MLNNRPFQPITNHARRARSTALYRAIVVAALIAFCFSQVTGADLAFVGQTPSDALSSAAPGAASLYNGQYSNSFPLFSLGSGGGPSAEFNLQYSSNVYTSVCLTNRDHQASWVGLGFEMGGEAILADNRYTVNLNDDTYFFVGGGGSVKLLPTDQQDSFTLSNGSLWKVERHRQLLNGRDHVVGWTIHKEDGSTHHYGDGVLYDQARDATRYHLAWGGTVGIGTSGNDSLIAYHWDLRRSEDLTGNHWLEYSYLQEFDSVKVRNPVNNDWTDNHFTRCSYPERVLSSTGRSVELFLGDRIDFERFHDQSYQEFFAGKRLDSLHLVDPFDQVISRKELHYSYLKSEPYFEDKERKLLLDSIVVKNGDATQSLPSTIFDYETSTFVGSYGAMTEITLPTGGVIDITYKTVEEDRIVTTLDTVVTAHIGANPRAYSARAWSRSCYIGKYLSYPEGGGDFSSERKFEIGSWNGYWSFEDVDDIVDDYTRPDKLEDQNYEVAAGEGWVVLYERDDHHFIVFENHSGRWVRDTIHASWDQTPGSYLQIWPADRFFVAVELSYSDTRGIVLNAHYYAKANKLIEETVIVPPNIEYTRTLRWTENEVYTHSGADMLFGGMQLANDLYALRLWYESPNAANYAVVFGKYDYATDELITGVSNWGGNSYHQDLAFVVGVNYVALVKLGFREPVRIATFDADNNPAWTWHYINCWCYDDGLNFDSPSDILGLRAGFVVHSRYPNNIHTCLRTADGWEHIVQCPSGGQVVSWNSANDSYYLTKYSASDHYTYVRSWVGDEYQQIALAVNQGNDLNDLSSFITDELAVALNANTRELVTQKYIGDGQWLGEVVSTDFYATDLSISRDLIATGKERIIFHYDDDDWSEMDLGLYLPDPIFPSVGVRHPDLLYSGNEFSKSTVYGDRIAFTLSQGHRAAYQVHRSIAYSPLSAYPFRTANTCLAGKPHLTVVEKVQKLEYDGDPRPIVQSYDYDGAILDPSMSSPRFCEVEVSTPYYADEQPEGYTRNYFYNDLDDSHVAQLPGRELPDLDSEETFGIAKGGYLLDGTVYRTVSYSATEIPDENSDYTSKEFEIRQDPNVPDWYRAFRPFVKKTKEQADQVVSEQSYEYDFYGRLGRTITFLADGFLKFEDTDFDDDATLNIFNRPGLTRSWVAGDGQSQQLSKAEYTWLEDGSGLQQKLTRIDASQGGLSGWEEWNWTLEFINSDDPSNCNYNDPFDCGTRYEEHLLIIPDNVIGPLTFELEMDVKQEGEYCEIWYEGDRKGFIHPVNVNCKAPRVETDQGQFTVEPGGELLIKLDNSVYVEACHGVPTETSCRATVTVPCGADMNRTEVYAYQAMTDRADNGQDAFKNVITWTANQFDTLSARFSPDGKYRTASINNGYYDECLFFDAEYDFDGANRSPDGWVNVNPALGQLDTDNPFTGMGSFRVDGAGYGGGGFLTRGIMADSLVSDKYVISFWHKTDGYTGGTGTIDIMGLGTTPMLLLYPEFDASSSDWRQSSYLLDLTDADGLTELYLAIRIQSPAFTSFWIDDLRFVPVDADVTTWTYDQSTGHRLSSAGSDNVPQKKEYDSFGRVTGTLDHKDQPLVTTEYYFSREGVSGEYDPTLPNYQKTSRYLNANQVQEVMAFYDGQGRLLQTRSTIDHGGDIHTLVSDAVTRNARGQVLKTYKPYLDLVAPSALTDYTEPASIATEADFYYDGTHGPSCGGIAFYENEYTGDLKSRLSRSAAPGPDLSMQSGYTTDRDYYTYISGEDTLRVSTTTDPDGVVSSSATDPDGYTTREVSFYTRSDGITADSLAVINRTDVLTETVRTSVDTGGVGTDEVLMAITYKTNDLGRVDSTWRVDYGMERMVYNRKGDLRFTQNAKQLAEDQFTYRKYDGQGRKVEEGEMSSASTYFTEAHAMDPDFPTAADGPVVAYRWFFDYYVFHDPVPDTSHTLLYPGQLVRVESGNQSYFKQFYYHTQDYWDLAVTRLPVPASSLKGVKHNRNRNGSIKSAVIQPDFPAIAGFRTIAYEYDLAGRLVSAGSDLMMDQVKFVEYSYNADATVDQLDYGIRHYEFLGNIVDDTVQRVDYSYNTAGGLLGINLVTFDDNSTVVPSIHNGVTGGSDNDHFGSYLEYYDGASGYRNGRVHRSRSVNSADGSVVSNTYTYGYNELGWLQSAAHSEDPTQSRTFNYNALGNRQSVDYGDGTSVAYEYQTGSPGSSRLVRTSDMAIGEYVSYDILGNMIADPSRDVHEQTYDYRNLLSYARVAPNLHGGTDNELEFTYDEAGQRIYKKHYYQYWEDCDPFEDPIKDPIPLLGSPGDGIIPGETPILRKADGIGGIIVGESQPEGGPINAVSDAGPGGGGQQCRKNTNSATAYWYDGGLLLATFDKYGDVLEMFVNDGQQTVAVFRENENAQLHYTLRDHLGSTRAIVKGVPDVTPCVAQYTNYHPFGQVQEEWGTYAHTFKYTGKERDKHSSFDYVYFGARYYDPITGRFLSIDPASQFASGYMFAGNNPIMLVDADGQWAWVIPAVMKLATWAGYIQTALALINNDYITPNLMFLSMVGIPTGIPNLYKGHSLGYGLASSFATNVANQYVTGAFTGAKHGIKSMFRKGMWWAVGVLGSEKFENWHYTKRFETWEQSFAAAKDWSYEEQVEWALKASKAPGFSLTGSTEEFDPIEGEGPNGECYELDQQYTHKPLMGGGSEVVGHTLYETYTFEAKVLRGSIIQEKFSIKGRGLSLSSQRKYDVFPEVGRFRFSVRVQSASSMQDIEGVPSHGLNDGTEGWKEQHLIMQDMYHRMESSGWTLHPWHVVDQMSKEGPWKIERQ